MMDCETQEEEVGYVEFLFDIGNVFVFFFCRISRIVAVFTKSHYWGDLKNAKRDFKK